MNLKTVFGGLIATAIVGTAIALQSGGGALAKYSQVLEKADGLSVKMSDVVVGGARASYSLDLAKGNKARMETPSMLSVSDGINIYTYYKQQKVYTKQPVTPALLTAQMQLDQFFFFQPFMVPNALTKLSSVRDAGTISRRGEELSAVTGVLDSSSGKQVKLLFASGDGLLRQVEFSSPKGSGSVLDIESFSIGAPAESRFAFKAPAGSKEISVDELNADKWFDNIDEALKVAKATNKVVLIDFMFEGCVWCAKLDAEVFSTQEFKDKVKGNFVLCRVDILKDTVQPAPYNVTGAPDIRFLKNDGTEVHKISGFVPLDQFLKDMDTALSSR